MSARPVNLNKEKLVSLTLKVPKELHEKIKKLAIDERRTINSQARIILEKYLEEK